MRVLLVEDDFRFAAALISALRRAGHEVRHVLTAADALAAPAPDIMLLDLGLPDGDGVEVCRRMRARGDVPIIMLTARAEERDRVIGLRGGADDYLVKPFGFAELQARIDAVLRRSRPQPAGVRTLGRLSVDLDAVRATVDGRPIPLTRKEFELLAVLVREPEAAVRRSRLFTEVWHTTWRGTSRTLDVHMATLRAKLGAAAQIETIRGVGYRIVPAPQKAAPPRAAPPEAAPPKAEA